MKPRGRSSGSLVMTTTLNWLMTTFTPSTFCFTTSVKSCCWWHKYHNSLYWRHNGEYNSQSPFSLYVRFQYFSQECPGIWIFHWYFSVIRLRVPVGCTTELNHLGHQFLQRFFDKYDEVSGNPSCLWSRCSHCIAVSSSSSVVIHAAVVSPF